MVRIRRTLHATPEVGLHLPETRRVVTSELQRMGLEPLLHTSTSGVVAVVRGGDAAPRLLRADMDALPMTEETDLEFASTTGNTMHACGHDLHTAMLLGAARLLAEGSPPPGPVILMFQPGEEGAHGAKFMLEEGLLKTLEVEPERAFAIHVFTWLPTGVVGCRPGPLMASSDEVKIRVVGRGGHASAPHRAADPVPVAAEILLAIQAAVTRQISVFEPAVVTFGHIGAGTVHNVIPESAFLHGTVRALSELTRAKAHGLIRQVAAGVGSAHGLQVDTTIDKGYPVTGNDPGEFNRLMRVGGATGIDVVEMDAPLMGSEDWSYVLARVPGTMAFLGACPPELDPEEAPTNHSNRVRFEEEAMATGAALYAAVASD